MRTPRRQSDRHDMRAQVQDAVHEYTLSRYHEDLADGVPEEECQRVIEEYNPVVELALVAVDRRTDTKTKLWANAEIAQYIMPKLKAVEVTEDPEAMRLQEERNRIAQDFMSMLDGMAREKSASARVIEAEISSDDDEVHVLPPPESAE